MGKAFLWSRPTSETTRAAPRTVNSQFGATPIQSSGSGAHRIAGLSQESFSKLLTKSSGCAPTLGTVRKEMTHEEGISDAVVPRARLEYGYQLWFGCTWHGTERVVGVHDSSGRRAKMGSGCR